MPRYDFDMFTIGAGSGGVASSRRAGSYGARVAICRGEPGRRHLRDRAAACRKSCWSTARNSPTPSPTPPALAGRVPAPSFDWPALIDAKDQRDRPARRRSIVNMLKNSGVELIEGRGVLVDPHTVEVDGRRLHRRQHPDRHRRRTRPCRTSPASST